MINYDQRSSLFQLYIKGALPRNSVCSLDNELICVDCMALDAILNGAEFRTKHKQISYLL